LSDSSAFGRIYLAKNNDDKVYYVMKIMEKEDVNDHDMKEQIKEEVRIQQKFNHPNLVLVKEVMEDDQHLYIVLEHMLRGDLYDVLYNENDKHMKEEEVKTIFNDLMQGVLSLHSNNIVHRDIKLENLLMDETGTVKITDFGSALDIVECKDKDEFSLICGTREYMAPEMLKEEEYSFSVDIWSCGVVLYELLNRNTPFDSDSFKKNHKKILKNIKANVNDIYYSKRLSSEAIDLLKKCFVLDPKKRLTAEQVLNHPFLNGVNDIEKVNKIYKPTVSHKKFQWIREEIKEEVKEEIKEEVKEEVKEVKKEEVKEEEVKEEKVEDKI
jgi:serine/threonine protein kinase